MAILAGDHRQRDR